jgi:hypothetical protein
MKQSVWQRLCDVWHADFFTPKDFLCRAFVICLAYLGAHLAGLREYTSILNGTAGSLAAGRELSDFLGVLFIIVYLAFIILAPSLVLAAAILAVWRRLARRGAVPR